MKTINQVIMETILENCCFFMVSSPFLIVLFVGENNDDSVFLGTQDSIISDGIVVLSPIPIQISNPNCDWFETSFSSTKKALL